MNELKPKWKEEKKYIYFDNLNNSMGTARWWVLLHPANVIPDGSSNFTRVTATDML